MLYTRVLVADDDWDFIRNTILSLDSVADLRIVTKGTDVLDSAVAWSPDVVLLDLLLQDIDGFALLEELLHLDGNHPPFVLLATDGLGAHTRLSDIAEWPVGTVLRSGDPALIRDLVLEAANTHREPLAAS